MDGARVPVIVGPTAVGKTALGLALAAHWPLEIVSADSRQIYRRLDIGTAKPTRKERGRVAHHGLDLIDPGTRYSAGHYARDAVQWLADIRARGRLPVVVGGTGLYIRAVADGLFQEPRARPRAPAVARCVHGATRAPGAAAVGRPARSRVSRGRTPAGGPRHRGGPADRPAAVALAGGGARAVGSRAVVHCAHRARGRSCTSGSRGGPTEMMQRGLIEEVASVLAEGHAPTASGLDGIGVREAVEYLHGARPRETVAPAITISTRQYAKRQQTWFRHQLTGAVLTLDATRPPERLAAEIAEAWTKGGA